MFHHRFGFHEFVFGFEDSHRRLTYACNSHMRTMTKANRNLRRLFLTSELLDSLIKHRNVSLFLPPNATTKQTIKQTRDVTKLKGFTHIWLRLLFTWLRFHASVWHWVLTDKFMKQEFASSFIGRRSVNLDKLTLISFANFSLSSLGIHFSEITSTSSSSLHG